MKQVYIPFLPEFKDAILGGRKFVTTRSKKYGDVGDVFTIFGETFILTSIFKRPLDSVATLLYEAEGFNSRAEFIECWEKIHPRVGFVPNREYWVHMWGNYFGKTVPAKDRGQQK